VLAVVKTVFTQPTAESAHEAMEHALQLLEARFPRVAEPLRAAETMCSRI